MSHPELPPNPWQTDRPTWTIGNFARVGGMITGVAGLIAAASFANGFSGSPVASGLALVAAALAFGLTAIGSRQ